MSARSSHAGTPRGAGRGSGAVVLLALVLVPGLTSCASGVAVMRRSGIVDSRTAADSLQLAILLPRDTTGAARDSLARVALLAQADSLRAAANDTSHATARTAVPTTSGARARKPGALGKPAEPPPLNIAAANVTGSHGPGGDMVMLNGDVRITRGRTLITADAGRYDRGAGMLYLDQRVRLIDSTTTLTCDHASFSEAQDVLWVNGAVTVIDRGAVLRAPSGTYDRRLGRADLDAPVDASDPKTHVRAQHVVYWRDRQLLQARGRVSADDLEHKLTLRADSVDYDRVSKDAVAIGQPELESRDDQGRSTLLRARRLMLNTDTRIARALDSVTVRRDTLQARADSARFDDVAGRGFLFGHPRAWDNETVVTGDTLEVWSVERKLERFVVRRNATIDYKGARIENLGESSRLKGDRVDVFFTGNVIDSVTAVGRARNSYTGVARTGKTPESNLAVGDTITIFFVDRKTDRARVNGNANGEFHFAVDPRDTSAVRNEMVRYDAPRIEYRVPQHTIVLEPRAHLIYKDLELSSGRVEFDSERQTLVASGSPALTDKGDKVSGRLMTYDIESQSGTIYEAETAYEKGIYRGEQIRKMGDDVLNVNEGSYTTCDVREPHYHFASKYMKIYLKDKLVAKPLVFYIQNVPLFALPFYVFPIKPGRHSGFLFPQIEFGFNNRTGQFIRNLGYYWAPNDYMDASLSGDYYRDDPSGVLRLESFYKLLYVLNGDLRASWVKDDRLAREEYDLEANHSQEISPRTRLVAGGSFVSSRDYRRSPKYGQFLGARLDRFLVSKLAITHNADWASVSAYADRRQDLDANNGIAYPNGFGGSTPPPIGTISSQPSLTASTPSLTVAFPTRAIGSFGPLRGSSAGKALRSLYLSVNARYLQSREERGVITAYQPYTPDPVTVDSTTVVGDSTSVRSGAAADVALSDARRWFGWLNVTPRFSSTVALFDHDNLGNTWVPTGVWSAAVSSGTTIYGTFGTHLGPISAIRHVVTPTVSYVYSPEFPSQANGRFTNFGSIGVSSFRNSRLGFTLDQRFQAKVRHGDQVERLDNLLSWTLGSSYNFLFREQGQVHPLSPIASSVRLQPPGIASADLSWTTDVYSQRPVRNLGLNASLALAGHMRSGGAQAQLPLDSRMQYSATNFDQPWSLGLAYSYSGGYASAPSWSSTQTLNLVASNSVTRAWRVDYLASYDINQRILLTQRFGVSRDLHCWFLQFSRSFIFNGEASYYFRVGIKEQRDLFYERGTRAQSLGGIN